MLRRVKIVGGGQGFFMIDGLGAYHPLAVFRAKRELKQDRAAIQEQIVDQQQAAAALEEVLQKRPEGFAGTIWDSSQYIEEAHKQVTGIVDRLKNMKDLVEQSNDPKIDDTARKGIQKQFNGLRQEIQNISQTDIKGDPLFSGRFASNGKALRFGEKKEEEVVLRINSLTPESLKIKDTRIDSLVMARRATKDIDRALTEVKDTEKMIRVKADVVMVRLERATAEDDDSGGVKIISSSSGLSQSLDARQVDLRMRQESAARAKGRTRALLINVAI